MKTVRTVFPKPYSAFHKQVQTYIPVSGVNGTSPNIKIDDISRPIATIKTENNDDGISVCISAWNTAEYIEECLDSVAAQTWFKTHDNWEILLGVDGCEKTLAKVKEIMHKYKNLKVMMMNENVGTYVTCNTIMKEANYGWLMRFDSDDIMMPTLIEDIMKERSKADFFLWKMQNFGANNNIGTTHGLSVIKKDLFFFLNGYKKWTCGADTDLINRIKYHYKTKTIDKILTKRRLHKNSLTIKSDTNYKSKVRIEAERYIRKTDYRNIENCVNEKLETTTFSYIIDKTKSKDIIMKCAKSKKFINFNIDNPLTWCEKVQYLQINENIKLRSDCADKLKLHEYSIKKLGKDICVPIIKIYNTIDEINFDELPKEFVLKCNHGYNFNIICRDKSKLNYETTKEKLKEWCSKPFGIEAGQVHYQFINRKFYAENFIQNEGQLEVTDYKFLCFNGEPKYCQIINGRHTPDFHLNYYDMDFNFCNISRNDVKNNPNKLDKKPEHFELMKEYAAKLSEDFHFVRVDFYEVNGIVYLGELTFTPNGGFIRWTDPKIDRMFGDMIKL